MDWVSLVSNMTLLSHQCLNDTFSKSYHIFFKMKKKKINKRNFAAKSMIENKIEKIDN